MNTELLERTLKNLKAMYLCNHEVMERHECVQLLADIKELEQQLASHRYDEALIKSSINLERFGADWLDEDGVKYHWLEDCEVFYCWGDYTYYTVKERLDDDRVAVVLAQKSAIVEIYQENYDITFLMEEVFKEGERQSSEVVSWYCGAPNPEDTDFYSKERRLIARY